MDEVQLWSMSMLWWGRAGKLLQFAGALTIVLDLVDPEKLRRWGQRMRGNPLDGLRDWAEQSAAMQALAFVLAVVLVAWVDTLIPDWLRRLDSYVFGLPDRIPNLWGWAFLLSLVAVGALLAWTARWQGVRSVRIGRRVLTTVLIVVVAALVLTLVVGIVRGVAPLALGMVAVVGVALALTFGVDYCIARPTAWLLDRKRPGQPLRWAAAILLGVGFHFDLLAS